MTWGAAADHIHDALDNELEDRSRDFLNVVTSSHKGESVDDVAWFCVNAALHGGKRVSVLHRIRRWHGLRILPISIRTAVNASV